jgi:hypothetical protein
MIVNLRFATALVLCAASAGMAQQSSAYVLTQFPLAAIAADSQVWVQWTGLARPGFTAPDSGVLYFDKSPGGGNINNYNYKVDKFSVDTLQDGTIQQESNRFLGGYPPKRGIRFRPKDQTGMGPGVYYYVVAFKTSILGHDTVFASNEMEMIVETDQPVNTRTPIGNITDLTPTFTWDANPGVPYYHVILSDEPLSVESTEGGGIKISGLSIIWQAITPKTQIVYGAPDPSGTITASPPPLSPGQTYSWVVLNNYGNQMAYTSTRYGLPKSFTIQGVSLAKPRLISPGLGSDTVRTYQKDSVITFTWTNLDAKANTYKVYLYMSYSATGAQSADAQLVVWQNEVTAGAFAGKNGVIDATDTGRVSINSHSVLTNNHYAWKVFAIDSKGASTASDLANFTYSAPAMGAMQLFTRERIVTSGASGLDTVVSPVAAVEMDVEVLSGSLEAPVLFYTDLNGNLYRDRPAGTCRITANKTGYQPLVQTLTLDSGATLVDTFFLKRPDATVYGKVLDEASAGIGAATVVAVSDRGDTVRAATDALGNFVLSCYAADWSVGAAKTSYVTSLPKKTTVAYGQNLNFGTIVLKANPFTVSGVVKNGTGSPIIAADVKILSGGQVIDECPATSQDGSFSFSLSPGTYTVYASRIGFTTYNKSVNVSSSMQLSVVMPAGAALLTGYVYGRTWVGASSVYAPITNATVRFTDTASTDTFTTASDATYGDFSASVPGGHVYKMISSAAGFVAHSRLLADTTRGGITTACADTLTALGMVSGTVKTSVSKAPVAGATVNLIDKTANQVTASATSQANGYFEMRNLADGGFVIRAGGSGYVTDSVSPNDTVYVSSGRTTIEGQNDASNLAVYMSPGSKSCRWVVNGGADQTASIKILSPLVKTLSVRDTVRGVGAGPYIVSVDGVADSIVDLAYHTMSIAVAETTVHVDSVSLPAYNATAETLALGNDSISLVMRSSLSMDSVSVYFKDASSQSFSVATIKDSLKVYSFRVRPQKDGSMLVYYFRAFRGADIYGYAQETFGVYVAPDSSKLTKLEITPLAGDTTLLPSAAQVTFTIKGYYGSQFIAATRMDSSGISWQLSGQGGTLTRNRGLSTVVGTGASASAGALQLVASIDTTRIKIDKRYIPSPLVAVYLRVSGTRISSIQVRRTDAQNPFPITTSSLSKAEFIAEGLDTGKNVFVITPVWNISPLGAGLMSADGVFKPAKKFVGNVRIWAQVGSLSGEFNPAASDPAQYGLAVQHLLVSGTGADTMSNLAGCTVVIPDSVAPIDKSALFQMLMPSVKNQIARLTGLLTVVGSMYDITELSGVTFRQDGRDSIQITLTIPQGANLANALTVGTWSEDSLVWTSLGSSKLSLDKKTVGATTTHFSRYAVLSQSGALQTTLSVLPNPFSPLRSPSDFPLLAAKFGPGAPKGTCISFTPDVPDDRLRNIKIRIYSVLGDLVCSVVNQAAPKMVQYSLWWDGRTTSGDVQWESLWDGPGENSKTFPVNGRLMCKNGRYFVVLTVQDSGGKEKSYRRQVILVK